MIKRSFPIKRVAAQSLVFFLSLSAAALMMRSSASEKALAGGSVEVSASLQGWTQSGSAPMLRLFVHTDDIYPNSIRVKPGAVRLRAENETPGDVALVLERVTQATPRQVLVRLIATQRARRADQIITLAAGEYEYYDEARPDVRGKLVVEDK